MELIPNQDRFDQVLRAGRGFVYNDFSGKGASGREYNVLHVAGCGWLARSSLSVRKFFFEDLRDAVEWLTRERGAEGSAWKRCGTCRAEAGAYSQLAGAAARPPTERAQPRELGQSPTDFCVQTTTSRVVEAWSAVRLPFQPSGYLVDFRDDLRAAVRSLEAPAGEGLHAVFTSPVDGLVDAENVLVYNVGAGVFAGTDHSELSFERVIGPVPNPPALAAVAHHHHLYEVRPIGSPWRHWSAERALATFGPTRLDPVRPMTPPSRVWHRIRNGTIKIEHRPTTPLSVFGLRVRLAVEQPSSPHLAAIIKPLLDGIIAAFHHHDEVAGSSSVAARVANQTGLSPEVVGEMLTDPGLAVLGGRRLLWPWREGVQWNPADDRCVAATVQAVRSNGSRSAGSSWIVSGEIYLLRSTHHPTPPET
jgi:hypothetical protein